MRALERIVPRRLRIIGLGHLLYYLFNFFFDNVLYVYVVYEWGMLRGGLFMAALAFTQNIITLLVYQKMGIDWVGSGLLREIKEKSNPSRAERFIIWSTSRSKLLMFVVLNIWQDPFIATAYFKEGNVTDCITRRDILILVTSAIFANAYWILVAAGIGNSVAFVWAQLF